MKNVQWQTILANRASIHYRRSERAFELSYYPNKGVGLMRMEFAISNSIRDSSTGSVCEPENN
jgi:hypothetical protein